MLACGGSKLLRTSSARQGWYSLARRVSCTVKMGKSYTLHVPETDYIRTKRCQIHCGCKTLMGEEQKEHAIMSLCLPCTFFLNRIHPAHHRDVESWKQKFPWIDSLFLIGPCVLHLTSALSEHWVSGMKPPGGVRNWGPERLVCSNERIVDL